MTLNQLIKKLTDTKRAIEDANIDVLVEHKRESYNIQRVCYHVRHDGTVAVEIYIRK